MATGKKETNGKKREPALRPELRKPFNWKGTLIVGGVVAFFGAMYMVRPESGMSHAPAVPGPIDLTPPSQIPERYAAGLLKFRANCVQCHGEWAQGTDQGPPLVHDFYKPSHHADFAFYRAAEAGVRAHHWRYGDMPPASGVTRQDMGDIIPFLRWWQRENGITG